MKKVNKILLCAVFLAAGNAGYCGTVAAPYEAGNWPGFRAAAISYTFDDGCPYQYTIAIPMFNEFGFKLTMFTVTGTTWYEPTHWDQLQTAASQGHEIASHTVTHPTLTPSNEVAELSNSKIAIEVNVPGYKCVTIAYPYCVPSTQSVTEQYYIAGRHCQGYIEANTPSNFYQISSIICGSSGSVKTTADFTARFTSAASSKGWCVFLIHGIDNDGGYSPLSSTVLRESVQYLDSHRSTFWVQTFANVVRYIRERNDATVTELSNTGNTITLQVTDTLNDVNYNYPLTIRRPMPAGWESAKVSQNGQPVATSFVDVNSIKYVMFDVVPDGGSVVLIKAPAAPANLTTKGFSTVALDWNDNNAIDLAGYNIYRSTTSGSGYTKLNDSLLGISNYIDDLGTIDKPYFYVATAVDVNSIESGYSNEISGGLYGDFTGNGIVATADLPYFFNFWVLNDCELTAGVDLDEDCAVNFYEYAVLAENWMQVP